MKPCRYIKKAVYSLLFVGLLGLLLGCKKDEVANSNKTKNNENKVDPPKEKSDSGFDKTYVFYQQDTTLKSKLFYFLLAIENDKLIKEQFSTNNELKKIKERYRLIFKDFSWDKYSDIPTLGTSLLLTTDEIIKIENVLDHMNDESIFSSMINNHIRPSGKYENFFSLEDKYLVKVIWRESIAKGINNIIKQYLIGEKPKYDCDGLKYQITSNEYKSLLEEAIKKLNDKKDADLFFSQLIDFVLSVLKINDRDEAIRFEPLESGENKKAIAQIAKIKWDEYPYSSILLLGDSPNSDGDDINLSKSAKQRIEYAMDAYKAKIAPIIIITGANIYPYQTHYFEAIEMKKWMINNYEIKESNIIVEPCARHTTTNLRNGSRLIFKYNIPTERKSIIITTKKQNDIITENDFKQRCINELGYMPIKLGSRLNNEILEFTPLIVSMHTNSLDPLDP